MRTLLAAVLLVACHSDPPPAAPVAPVSSCAKVADHLVTLMSASKHVAQDQLDPVRNMLTGHCNNDKWSAEIQQCALSAAAPEDLKNCQPLFTPEQEKALEADPGSTSVGPQGEATGGGAPAVGGAPPMAPAADMAPPPPPSPPKSSKKPSRNGGDPCEGGE